MGAKRKTNKRARALDWTGLALWPHQRDAITTCISYFSAGAGRSALVHYPTGSGKTGVMAVLAALRATRGPTLVVCPSDALVEQLQAEFISEFWDRIGAGDEWRLPNTLRLYPSTIGRILNEIESSPKKRIVAVGTIQALQQIHASQRYEDLAGVFSTVMFDEGHREPAPRWAAAVRGLGAPTILFSATPYRNDYKLFQIDDGFISFLSFTEASRDGLIRPVEITEEPLPDSPVGFARHVIAFRDRLLREKRVNVADKVIVRADTEQAVDDLYMAFKDTLARRPECVLAIHHNFADINEDGGAQLKHVPEDLRKRTETFLVHQFKLIEGIDDPACRILALYSPFDTERQLVQQIGRLTRHPGPIGTIAAPAYVLARRGDDAEGMWRRFLDYDQACIDNDHQPPIRGDEVIHAILNALPALEYVDGKFRRRADFADPNLGAELVVPLSATIYGIGDQFDVDEFGEQVDRALQEEDRELAASGSLDARDCSFRLSLRLNQTPFLSDSLFQTASLELTVYCRVGDRLFFYDSAGLNIDEHPHLNERLSPRGVSRLLPQLDGSAVTSLTLRNTDLSPLAIRGRSMRARSLDRSGIFMGEQSHVATGATGYKGTIRRSINLARGRIRQAEGVYHSVEQYAGWCEEIAAELDHEPEPAHLFNRFAIEVQPPDDPTPRNILLDLWEFADRFVDEEGETVIFDFEGVCVDIETTDDGPAGFPFKFDLAVNGGTLTVYLKYDAKKAKYWVKAQGLSGIKDRHNEKMTLARRINQYQPFRIIVDATTVFAYGKFYSVRLNLTKPDGPGATVLGLLTPLDGLRQTTSEKGDLRQRAQTWPGNSLFRYIDDELASGDPAFGAELNAVVCDDLGDEAGDFIGYNDSSTGRAVLIAAKWKNGVPGAGASPLYDVVAQTIKNLGYLKSDGDPLPGGLRKFDQDWRLNGGAVPRRRLGPGSLAFRRTFSEVRARPSTRREAWLILGGGMLSKNIVAAGFRAHEPDAHVLQLFHLLLSLYAICQSVGVEPKIFCAE